MSKLDTTTDSVRMLASDSAASLLDAAASLAARKQLYEAALEEQREKLDRQVTLRQGFQLEVAGGVTWEAPNAVFDRAHFARWGFWVTPAWSWRHVKLVGVLRWLADDSNRFEEAHDYGFRCIYAAGDFGVSAEGVARDWMESDEDSQFRFSGHVEYRIASKWWLNLTFGRDFDDKQEDSLLAQFGLAFNVAQDRYLPAHSIANSR
ncbi:MAG TPA: hypothetical protein VE131_13550 [Terriglobales bacterium]|nr:hypothetical protein [Terriglobales bacterium]